MPFNRHFPAALWLWCFSIHNYPSVRFITTVCVSWHVTLHVVWWAVPNDLKDCGAFKHAQNHSHKNRVVFLNCLTCGDECTAVLENMGQHLPSDTVSHPKTLESSAAWQWEPQTCKYIHVHAFFEGIYTDRHFIP